MARQRRRAAGLYSIEEMRALYHRPEEAARPGGDSDRIHFEGAPWVAFNAEMAERFALGDIPGFDLPQRVYFAALARLEPRGAATFDSGELRSVLGATDAQVVAKALRVAKERGLILDDSDAREVWVSSEHAQRPVGGKFRSPRVQLSARSEQLDAAA